MMFRRVFICAFIFISLAFAGQAALAATEILSQDRTAAVIISYQRIGEDAFAAANIDRDQFAAHIQELKKGDYNVAPLPAVVDALKKGAEIPPHTVVLTFDGGHRSVLDNAVPLLLEAGLPFTLFVATDFLDHEQPDYINWADLKKLAKNKLVTIGLHPASYNELNGADPSEIKRQINAARARLREMLGVEAALFAYPFGQYSSAYRDIVAASGFDAAFGQQSGVAYAGADIYSLPRFVMTGNFSDLDRFEMTANALPLPVTDIEPRDPQLTTRHPALGFTVDPVLAPAVSGLVCFIAGQDKPKIEIVGKNRVEVRLQKDIEDQRVRINCTMPGPLADPDEDQRWRWFGMLLTTPADADAPAENDDVPPEESAPAAAE